MQESRRPGEIKTIPETKKPSILPGAYPQEARRRRWADTSVGIKPCPEFGGFFVKDITVHSPTKEGFQRVAIQASHLKIKSQLDGLTRQQRGLRPWKEKLSIRTTPTKTHLLVVCQLGQLLLGLFRRRLKDVIHVLRSNYSHLEANANEKQRQ